MTVYLEEIPVSTQNESELIDVTKKIEESVRKSQIKNGLCSVYAFHTTTAIVVNEHEGGLLKDFLKKMGDVFPRDAEYFHTLVDKNAVSHLGAMFLGVSETFPVREGKLVLGRWQSIFLVELDGPQKRMVGVQLVGE